MSLSKQVFETQRVFEARITFSSKILLFEIHIHSQRAREKRRELGEHTERFFAKVSINPFPGTGSIQIESSHCCFPVVTDH